MAENENGFTMRLSHTPKVFSLIEGQKAAHLAWQSLSFSVKAKTGRKVILNDITGHLKQGNLTCILGPSGSGKTSMLNILAGRVKAGGKNGAEIKGEVIVNGKEIKPSAFQHLFGYVMQDDALLGTMTPREILTFSAKLRLNMLDKNQLEEVLTDMLKSLGLTNCADTMVGNELIKGISGGERKRTAVGAELITNPQITFLDEPTSGLDTASAYSVVSLMKELTKCEQSVLCTIHQPSSEIFHLFDQAIFLSAGQVVYHGPPGGISAHFKALGNVCPSEYNPADFVMFLVQTADDAKRQEVAAAWKEAQARDAETRKPSAEDLARDLPQRPTGKGFFTELSLLCVREAKSTVRDKGTLGARFVSTAMLTLIYSLVFFRIGSTDTGESVFVDRGSYDLQSHSGALTMLGISGMFGAAQPLLLTFASERPVFIRERASDMYGTVPYFLCKSLVELPLLVLQNLLMILIAYWAMALQGNFFLHIVAITLVSAASTSIALLAACIVKDAKQAMEAAPGLFVPQILFAGFFIKMELVPPFTRWLQYICPLKWGMNMVLINEFGDYAHKDSYFEANNITEEHLWIYAAVLVGLTLCFRILAVLALSRKAKAFYN